MKTVFIQADRQHDGSYVATELAEVLDELLQSYEYGDVFEEEYQIWEHPSGKVYKVVPDRSVDKKHYYSSPAKDIWLPRLEEVRTDVEMVKRAYDRLKDVSR
jgi:hypothetical protein